MRRILKLLAVLGVLVLSYATTSTLLQASPASERGIRLQLSLDGGDQVITETTFNLALELAEKVHGERVQGPLWIKVVAENMRDRHIAGLYNPELPGIKLDHQYMRAGVIQAVSVIAHELGHHILTGGKSELTEQEINKQHCDMYKEGGYDHQVLRLLGILDTWNYVGLSVFEIVDVCSFGDGL